MAATPGESEKWEGGERQDDARAPLTKDGNWRCPPGHSN